MNPITNELRNIETLEDARHAVDDRFETFSSKYDRAAKQKLLGKKSTFVSKTSGGKLSKWASRRRKQLRKESEKIKVCNEYYENIR